MPRNEKGFSPGQPTFETGKAEKWCARWRVYQPHHPHSPLLQRRLDNARRKAATGATSPRTTAPYHRRAHTAACTRTGAHTRSVHPTRHSPLAFLRLCPPPVLPPPLALQHARPKAAAPPGAPPQTRARRGGRCRRRPCRWAAAVLLPPGRGASGADAVAAMDRPRHMERQEDLDREAGGDYPSEGEEQDPEGSEW